MATRKQLRAIDLYSGVGGWSLGLRMAGIKVVASYERSPAANATNAKNNFHATHTTDLRKFKSIKFPNDIDIVVGSPPCTQFSFSNRGGTGDIRDGLKDLIAFFSIVQLVKPKLWALENVPRVKEILEEEMRPGGKLREFRNLPMEIQQFNLEDFGVPQRRKRCIIGNFDFSLLSQYSASCPKPSLREIIDGLSGPNPTDPIFGGQTPADAITDHVFEDCLSDEEIRINQANKLYHPIYNSMPFPDDQSRSARTITATCTRVSRESIVVEVKPGQYRRLTLRERASVQTFPTSFQFFGNTHSEKLKMIGNAMPPLFSYHIGKAMQKTKRINLTQPIVPEATKETPKITTPESPRRRYRWDRKFRFAIPSLRLKSGVRFELTNLVRDDIVAWKVRFFFGSSKSIHEIELDEALLKRILKKLPQKTSEVVAEELRKLSSLVRTTDSTQLQRVWTHTGPGTVRPLELLDRLNHFGKLVVSATSHEPAINHAIIANALKLCDGKIVGIEKLLKYSPTIVAGLIIGATTNVSLRPTIKRPSVQSRKLKHA